MVPPVARKPASKTADVVTLPDGTTVRRKREEQRAEREREKK